MLEFHKNLMKKKIKAAQSGLQNRDNLVEAGIWNWLNEARTLYHLDVTKKLRLLEQNWV